MKLGTKRPIVHLLLKLSQQIQRTADIGAVFQWHYLAAGTLATVHRPAVHPFPHTEVTARSYLPNPSSNQVMIISSHWPPKTLKTVVCNKVNGCQRIGMSFSFLSKHRISKHLDKSFRQTGWIGGGLRITRTFICLMGISIMRIKWMDVKRGARFWCLARSTLEQKCTGSQQKISEAGIGDSMQLRKWILQELWLS